MKTVTFRRVNRGRLTRAAMFGLLALAAVLVQSREARAQWTTSGTTTSTTNNVGIGTNTPASTLEVQGPDGGAITLSKPGVSSKVAIQAATGYDLHMSANASWAANVWGRHDATLPSWNFFLAPSAGGDFAGIRRAAPSSGGVVWTDIMRFTGAGNVGIGTSSPAARLHTTAATNTVNATLLVVPNADNTYYAGNNHDAVFIDGSSAVAHGMYTSAAFNLMRIKSADAWDSVTVGRFGELNATPRTGKTGYTLSLAPDSGNGYYAGHSHDILLINGAGTTPHGLYTGSTVRLMRVVNGSGGDALTISRDGNANFGGNVGIGAAPSAAKLNVGGDLHATGTITGGNITAKYQDVAEWVPTTQKLNAGTVVVLDVARDNHVAASSSSYDTRVAGVISAQPGISLGEAGEGKVLVATTGRVKVKVDATQGPIKVGDLLVTSGTPGVAMKSQPLDLGGVPIHRPGTLIGKALESLEKGTGEILVLLSLQ